MASNLPGRALAVGPPPTVWPNSVREINDLLLLAHSKSWFNGHNINLDRDAKPRVMVYLGGAPRYRRRLAEEAHNGYPSFELRSSRVGATAGQDAR